MAPALGPQVCRPWGWGTEAPSGDPAKGGDVYIGLGTLILIIILILLLT